MSKEKNRYYKSIYDWEDKIVRIFPIAIPNECVWTDEIDILNVLFTLCSNKTANIFYPQGKKLGLYGVDFSKEDKCIELITENSIDVVSPCKLSFHHYDEAFEWSYFRLEINNLVQISDIKSDSYKELLICLEDGEYLDILNDMDRYYNEDEMYSVIDNAIVVNRYLKKSSFLIFARNSSIEEIYNKSFNLYSDKDLSSMIENLIINRNI